MVIVANKYLGKLNTVHQLYLEEMFYHIHFYLNQILDLILSHHYIIMTFIQYTL